MSSFKRAWMQRLPVPVRQEEGALASFINTQDRVTVVYILHRNPCRIIHN